MVTQLETGADVFRAVADPTRRAILGALRKGARPVNEIVNEFTVSRPAVSRHLRILRNAGLVHEKREGRMRMYHLDPAPLKQMDRWLQEYRSMWARKLQNLKTFSESNR